MTDVIAPNVVAAPAIPLSLHGRTAIVTGAASGIGRAITVAFVRAGAQVVSADIDEAGVHATAELTDDPDRVLPFRADVSSETEMKALVDATIARFGRLTTLVNNAAVSLPGTVVETSLQDFDRSFAVNVRAAFVACQLAIPHMLSAGGGSIINMGSVNSLVAERMLSSYCVSKGALLMLTKSVALDFAEAGVRCNCICPGWVDTPINLAHAERLGGLDAVRASLPQWQPLGREGRPAEIANVAAFLASDLSSFMTGSAVVVDGGMTAA